MKILLVDDEQFIQDYLKRVIGKEFEFKTAFDGGEALKITSKEVFDLIITDLSMAGMKGDEFVQTFRKSDKTTPIILHSSNNDLHLIAEELGVIAMSKNSDPYQIRTKVKSILKIQ
jgi:DNA-binding response OmpR family regulator